MASIPAADDTNPAVAALLDGILKDRGMLGPLHRQMAHVPALVEAFERYSTTIRTRLAIEYELFGLVVLRTVQAIGDAYEWPICVSIGRKAGIDDAKIVELWDWRNSPHFSPRHKAALAIVDEHCIDRPARRTAAAAARAELTDPEIVSVCAVMGWFQLIGAFTMPLDLAQDRPATQAELVAIDARHHAN